MISLILCCVGTDSPPPRKGGLVCETIGRLPTNIKRSVASPTPLWFPPPSNKCLFAPREHEINIYPRSDSNHQGVGSRRTPLFRISVYATHFTPQTRIRNPHFFYFVFFKEKLRNIIIGVLGLGVFGFWGFNYSFYRVSFWLYFWSGKIGLIPLHMFFFEKKKFFSGGKKVSERESDGFLVTLTDKLFSLNNLINYKK